jgi:hypothetical protein
MPAASTGLSKPESAASYATRLTAAKGRLIVVGARRRCFQVDLGGLLRRLQAECPQTPPLAVFRDLCSGGALSVWLARDPFLSIGLEYEFWCIPPFSGLFSGRLHILS